MNLKPIAQEAEKNKLKSTGGSGKNFYIIKIGTAIVIFKILQSLCNTA